jgi:cation diffusion facilitator family transporter
VSEKATVLTALAANLVIAIAKGVAGVLTGSSAMLAEAAHSVADTVNQSLMLVSLSLSERPPDEEHPFGHGKERFFWTFLACVLIFFSGAIFSVGDGVRRLISPSESGSFALNYLILGISGIAEGASLVRAYRHTSAAARDAGLPLRHFVRESTEPTTKTVLGEDTVAVLGLVAAFAGILLAQLTGNPRWDAGGAIVIGLMLMYVAVWLGRNMRGLLIGQAATPRQRERIRAVIAGQPEVAALVDLRTMYVGPQRLLVAARIDLADELTSRQIEELAERIDHQLRQAVPDVFDVFLDPTPARRRRP